MKMLTSVAVFGLVPIPSMTDTSIKRCGDLRVTSEDVDFSQRMSQARPIIERMATKEDLARIRSVLNEIDGGIIGAR